MVYGQRIAVVARKCQTGHATEFPRKSVSDNRNDSHGTQCNQRERDTVVARNHVEVLRLVLDDIVHLRDIARSLLDGHDVLEVACQPQSRFGRHVHARTSRYVIEHHRKLGSFGNGFVMLVNTFLRRFIVVRNSHQYGIYSREVFVFQGVEYGLRTVAADTQQDGYTTVDAFYHHLLDLSFFFFCQCRSFCSGSQYTKKIHPVLYLIFNESQQCIIIHATVTLEGSNQRHPHSFQSSCYHK